MNAGIVISAGFMILMAGALVYSLKTLMDAPTVSLVVPGVEVPGSPIFIPLLSGLIALATVLIVHEFITVDVLHQIVAYFVLGR